MTSKKTARRALFSSVVALMLCVAMLVGTTFAWFTDSVTVANNTITAGNLDVEMYYAPVTDADGVVYTEITDDMWKPVKADSKLFKEDTLWEPGHAQAVYLKIVNEGTLAFKYTLDVLAVNETTGTSVLGNEIKLSDILMVDMHQQPDNQILYTGRTEGADAVTIDEIYQDWGSFFPGITPKHKALSALETDEGMLEPEETMYVQLGVYMPTTVANEANYRGTDIPQINLGITVLAAQVPYEKDSFGDDYDEDAEYPKTIAVSDPAELADALASANKGDTVALAAGDWGVVALNQAVEGITLTADAGAVVEQISITAPLTDVTLSAFDTAVPGGGYANAFVVVGAGADGTTLKLDGCVFDASTSSNPNAIHSSAADVSITATNCTFIGTRAYWTSSSNSADLTFENCDFVDIDSWVLNHNNTPYDGNLTVNNCTFTNCTDGMMKMNSNNNGYIAAGNTFTFTNNTLTNCKGHDGSDAKWFAVNTVQYGATAIWSNNTLDGAIWTPDASNGLTIA